MQTGIPGEMQENSRSLTPQVFQGEAVRVEVHADVYYDFSVEEWLYDQTAKPDTALEVMFKNKDGRDNEVEWRGDEGVIEARYLPELIVLLRKAQEWIDANCEKTEYGYTFPGHVVIPQSKDYDPDAFYAANPQALIDPLHDDREDRTPIPPGTPGELPMEDPLAAFGR